MIERNGKFSIDYLASIMAANLAKTRSNWYASNAHVTQSATIYRRWFAFEKVETQPRLNSTEN